MSAYQKGLRPKDGSFQAQRIPRPESTSAERALLRTVFETSRKIGMIRFEYEDPWTSGGNSYRSTSKSCRHHPKARYFIALQRVSPGVTAPANQYPCGRPPARSPAARHLRRDLDHPCVSCQARSEPVQSGGTAAFHRIRILPPGDSNSMTHSGYAAAPSPINSTNAGLCCFPVWLGIPPSRCFNRV